MKTLYAIVTTFAIAIFTTFTHARPTVGAPTPPAFEGFKVVSVFSDNYINIAETDFNPNWGQSTVGTQLHINENNVPAQATPNYQSMQDNVNPFDASAMTHLHIDIYPTTGSYVIKLTDVNREQFIGKLIKQ